MMARTSTTANALLGLLALREEWTTWELTSQLRRNLRFFWPRAESRILAELKRLDRDGLVRSRKESIGRRPRTVYAITGQGRGHVTAWLDAPPRSTALESEPLLRVLLGDLGTVDAIRRAVDQVERDAQDILAVGPTVAAEYRTDSAPFQDQVPVRAFVFDYLATQATGMLDWAVRTRTALDERACLTDTERAEHAVQRINQREQQLPQNRTTIPTTSR